MKKENNESNVKTNESANISRIVAIAVGVLVFICVIVLIVTNSNKTLSCSYTTDDSDKINYKMDFKFDKDEKIKDLSIVMVADIANADEYKNAEDKKKMIEDAKKELEESDQYSSVKVNGTVFTITFKIKDIEQYGSKYDDIKSRMEKLNYTCK